MRTPSRQSGRSSPDSAKRNAARNRQGGSMIAPRRLAAAVALTLTVAFPTLARARTWEVASDTTNPGQRLVNALLNAEQGDRIHVQSPGPYVAPPGGWRIKRSLELYGDGAGRAMFQDRGRHTGTLLQPHSTSDPVLVLDLSEVPVGQSLWNVYLHDLQIGQEVNVPAPASPSSNGVYLKITDEKTVGHLRLSRLFVYGMGNDGIHLEGRDGTYDPVGVSLDDCISGFNPRHGLFALYANQLNVRGGAYEGNWTKAAQIQTCPAVHMEGTTFESNQKSGAIRDTLAPAQVYIEKSGGFQLSGCHFEGFTRQRGPSQTAVTINSPGGFVGDCYFYANTEVR